MERLPTLATVPIEALDASFEERVRAAPRAEQDRLLEEADRLRVLPDDDASWRCLTIYRALHERLAGGAPADLERAAWCSGEDPARDAVARRMAELVLRHPDEARRDAAACVVAECETVAGQFVQAERRLRELLPRARGRGDATEIAAFYALAMLYAWQRRELESLVLARRAQDVAESRPDLHPVHRAHALSVLGDAYRSLDDEDHLRLTGERMAALSREMSEPDAGRLRRQAHVLLHEAAMLRGDLPQAREQLEAARREVAGDLRTAGHAADPLAYYEVRFALRSGQLDRVGDLVARHGERARGHPTIWMLWALVEVEWVGSPGTELEFAL